MINYVEIAGDLLPAIAYGDAAGLPFEGQTPREDGSVEDLLDTSTNPFLGPHPAGTWSDDTHLSLAVAKSVMEVKGFDLESQADWHVTALRHVNGAENDPDMVPPIVTDGEQKGWGHSTTSSVERLKDGVSPRGSGHPEGSGNGVLMKMAPLVLWQIARQVNTADADQQLTELTRMTHDSPVAVVSSLTHRRYLENVAAGLDASTALIMAHEVALELETDFGAEREVSRSLGKIAADDFLELPDRDKILQAVRRKPDSGFFGFFAPDTLAMAYGSFVLEHTLPDSVFRAVELGGDSDSVGSIVAVMSLLAGKSDESVDQLPSYDELFNVNRLQQVSRRLAGLIEAT